MLATNSPVEAGMCSETGTTGVWTCTGAANSSNDDTQSITGRANQNIDVTGNTAFGLNSSNNTGYGVEVTSVATTGTIDVNLSNSNDITSYYDAISIYQYGTGAVTVTTNGTLRSSDYSGIEINQSGNGNVTVTTDGTVTGGTEGINISTVAGTTGEVNLTTNATVTGSEEGIKFDIDGNNTVTVIATGMVISSSSEEAIEIEHSGTGDVNITTSDTVAAAAKDGIRVNHTGTGNITLTVNGSVVGDSSANAINLSTTSASSNATIILGSGASFTGGIDVSGVMGDASIEIGGTGDRSFDIGNTPAITGDRNFDKSGDHTLTVTGIHASGAAFAQTNINEGKLVWEGTDFRTTSLTIGNGAIFEITGSGSFTDASVTLSGRLELAGNSSSVAVESLAGDRDSDLDIDVDFSGGDAELSDARLTATLVTGTIPVNIKSMNEFQVSDDDEDGFITLENFLVVADSDAFVAGDVLDNGSFDFDVVYDSDNNYWNLVACPVNAGCRVTSGGIEELLNGATLLDVALYESLPAALTQLASLQSYQQRLQGRRHGNNGGVWAKVSGNSTEFEPTSTSLATHEIGNVTAEFGIDVPLITDYPYIPYNLTVGASAVFGGATTDVTAGNSTGEIATRTFKASVSANWEHEDLYVDGQLQYATFGNEIKADAKLADENASAYSAGLEVGYGFDVKDFRVTPSAQLTWTSVDFDHFTDLEDTRVALDDDTVFTGRAGVGVEGAVPSLPDILMRGRAGLLMPLDGRVATRINETKLTSEREDPLFDAGIGATYHWNEIYALSADVSTQQGGEVGGYSGNIGFKYKF